MKCFNLLRQLAVFSCLLFLLVLSACNRQSNYSKGSLAPDSIAGLSLYGTVTSGLTSHNTTVAQSGPLKFKYDFDANNTFTNYDSTERGKNWTANVEVLKGHYTYTKINDHTASLHLTGMGIGKYKGKQFEEIHHLNFQQQGKGSFVGNVKVPVTGQQKGSFEIQDY